MITEPLTGARKPEQTDGPLGGLQIANVIDDLAPNTVPSFANATARNTAYSNWVAAGGVMRKGLKSHTQNDDRYWRYDGSGWQYAGGAPPPIVAASVLAGWGAGVNYAPGVYKDANGLVRLVGGVRNGLQYTPNGNHAVQLPTGYRPAVNQAFNIAVNGSPTTVLVDVQTDGVVAFVSNGGVSIAADSVHTLSGIAFHPTYTGVVPLA